MLQARDGRLTVLVEGRVALEGTLTHPLIGTGLPCKRIHAIRILGTDRSCSRYLLVTGKRSLTDVCLCAELVKLTLAIRHTLYTLEIQA